MEARSMEEKLGQFLKAHFSCDILQATNEQLYQALVWYIREIVGEDGTKCVEKGRKTGKKAVLCFGRIFDGKTSF